MGKWYDRIFKKHRSNISYLRGMVGGGLYKISDIRSNSDWSDIRSQIEALRGLATDSQIDTALDYYSTDATTLNSKNQIIWATATEDKYKEVENIINNKFKEWKINRYARDHIIELVTIGNLYLPTTDLYKEPNSASSSRTYIGLDNNTIPTFDYDIVPSTKLSPEEVVHLWYQGKPSGFVYQPDEDNLQSMYLYPESSIIHFTLGGLLGEYKMTLHDNGGEVYDYDIQFGSPLMKRAIQPTQTLSILENAVVLSSLIRTVKFINVECNNAEEEEVREILTQIKDMIEQQLSINTASGDVESFINPQSPNNLIYLPRINGSDPISITDLNMADATDADNKLLDYYQNKKLSTLGIPKEALNFSGPEGLGNSGNVMTQRSALYGNAIQRIETAYVDGWADAFNKFFIQRNLTEYVDKFELHMNPVLTQLSTINFDRRDSAISQASSVVDLLNRLGVTADNPYRDALSEILQEVFPTLGSQVNSWNIEPNAEGGDMGAI